MSDQINNDKGFLRDKLGDYQVDPPPSVWDSIADRMSGGNRRGTIFIILSAAASIALAISLGIHFFGPDLPRQDVVAEVESLEEPREEPLSIQSSGPVDLENQAGQQVMAEAQTARQKVKEIEKESQKVQLEDKVIKAMESVAEQQPAIVAQEISTDLTTQLNSELADSPDEKAIESEGPEHDQIIEPDTEPEVELSLDPGDNIPDDPGPDIESKPKRDPRWVIGAVLSPLYTFRDAESNAMAGASVHESGMLSYAGGVHVSYRGASRLSIESGIYFNKMGLVIGAPGIQLFNRALDFAPQPNVEYRTDIKAITNSVGNIISESGEIFVNNYKLNSDYETNAFADPNIDYETQNADQGIEQHLDYLELPFNLRFTVIDRAIELQLVGGMSTNFLVNNYVTMETASGLTEIGYLTNIRSVNYSGNAGVGMIYHIHEKFSLRLEPRFRYFLNSVNDATLPSTRPYTVGIYTGLSYTF